MEKEINNKIRKTIGGSLIESANKIQLSIKKEMEEISNPEGLGEAMAANIMADAIGARGELAIKLHELGVKILTENEE